MAKEIVVQNQVLVPKHFLMTEQEVEGLLQHYNISKKQMPMISVKDPAIQGLNAKTGDVIRIVRNSPTQGKAEFYRVVKE